MISRASEADEGKYQCVAKNAAGVRASQKATLQIQGEYDCFFIKNKNITGNSRESSISTLILVTFPGSLPDPCTTTTILRQEIVKQRGRKKECAHAAVSQFLFFQKKERKAKIPKEKENTEVGKKGGRQV